MSILVAPASMELSTSYLTESVRLVMTCCAHKSSVTSWLRDWIINEYDDTDNLGYHARQHKTKSAIF